MSAGPAMTALAAQITGALIAWDPGDQKEVVARCTTTAPGTPAF